jgi:[NiFe] hydrogenase diaphorase moiety large subunit
MLRMLDKIIEGKGTSRDLQELEEVCNTVKMMSRCGLGQTAPNPILTTLKNFPKLYSSLLKAEDYIPTFNWDKALSEGIALAGRGPEWEGEEL